MTPEVKKFLKLLNDFDQSKYRTEIFADFCELSYCALAKVASPFPEQKDALEAQYLDVVARYRNKDVRIPLRSGRITVDHRSHKGLNNRSEAAHRPTRRREKIMGRFKSPHQAQRFLSVHDQTATIARPKRHRICAAHYGKCRADAFSLCNNYAAKMAT